MKFTQFLIMIAFFNTLFQSCSRDQLEESVLDCDDSVTYTNKIKPILDGGCAYNGCHDGGAGIGPSDYNSYDGLLSHINAGSFRSRTLNQRDDPVRGMPPDSSVYSESLKNALTPEELNYIECWLDSGFPE